jgi:2-methylcitrate dehydratase PrpD
MSAGQTSAELEALAAFAAEFDLSTLPAELLPTARACVLYGLAVGVSTLRVPSAHRICAMIDADGGTGAGTSTRLLDGQVSSTGNAALANSVLLSGRAQGDSHTAGHIGGVAIPSALAIAQAEELSGAEFLSAMIVGYEVGLRIGRDHSAPLSTRGFRTTPTYGVFTAAAAGARGLRLGASETADALAIAANLASGLREYVNAGTEESPFQAGFAARNGLSAALLAATGVNAAHSALHGPAGFFSAYGGADSDHGSRLVEGLGEEWEFTHVTYKPYPACQFLRGMISGLIALRRESAGGTPVAIEVRLNPFEADFIGVRYYGPFSSPAQTVMSAPFCAALTWATGTTSYVGMRTYDDDAVNELVPLVTIVGDDSIQRYQTHLRVELADGRVLTLEDNAAEDAYDMNWDAAVESARALCAETGAPAELTERLIEAAAGIDTAPDTAALVSAVRAILEAATP